MTVIDLFKKRKRDNSIKKKTSRKLIGDIGEDLAADYLMDKGYDIVARNVRISHKEIDIVAKNDLYTVIVEVKTLSLSKQEAEQERHRASEQIDREKAKNIILAANAYKNMHYDGRSIRIDVIEVYLGANEPEIVHIENAIGYNTLNRHRR